LPEQELPEPNKLLVNEDHSDSDHERKQEATVIKGKKRKNTANDGK
jgi:hypothetical protein